MKLFIPSLLLVSLITSGEAADWPMWRTDAGRTASTPQPMPASPKLLWRRELAPITPAFRDARLQFDRGHEPIVVGNRLFVGSSREDNVTAYDTETGEQLWVAHAEGPVRFAPVADRERVIFGSDDGFVRCVSAETGELVWQRRAVPSNRCLLGNGRLISVWPIRGGPVIKNGRVYFAAGVWPLEGVFIGCLDAKSGNVIWLNDQVSYIYGVHPHQAEAFGGVTPQGYLLIDGEDLIVPCSAAYPARFDLATGRLEEFELPSAGRLPGGWFASTPEEKEAQKLRRRGLLFDDEVNAKRHEDKPRAEGLSGVKQTFRAADEEWHVGALPFFEGEAHSVVVADDKCFVVTEAGHLLAFADEKVAAERGGVVKEWPRAIAAPAALEANAEAARYVEAAGGDRGYAVVCGLDETGFVEGLLRSARFQVVALAEADPEPSAPNAATRLRERLVNTGAYGERAAVLTATVEGAGLPPFFASLIAIAPGADPPDGSALKAMYGWLRPYGGRIVGPPELLQITEAAMLPGARLQRHANGLAVISRDGALPGSTNYTGGWESSEDLLVRAPFGVLWFDDALSHFKRSPQPQIIDGVMVSWDKDWLDASHRKGPIDYRLLPPSFSDVYTGRVLDEYEAPELRQRFAQTDLQTIQPNQYRPPQQPDHWKPAPPQPGERINPLTGEREPRVFPKSYGCDGGVDYGHIYSMRSGTAAFYDKRLESGTIHISGPRSGCTNSIVPANGLLNVPYFYEGCTCSYPLPMAVSLVPMPSTFEQWATWGAVPSENLAGKIERVGINLGAPGDRKTVDGTLWLDFPSVGGPSPEIDVRIDPPSPKFYYRHSVWMEGGEGWPWVAASGVEGLHRLTVAGLKTGSYTVRLTFCEPNAGMASGTRQFDVRIQDKWVMRGLDVIQEAKGAMRAVTRTVSDIAVNQDGRLTVELDARSGKTILSGVEVIRSGLDVGSLPAPAVVPGRVF